MLACIVSIQTSNASLCCAVLFSSSDFFFPTGCMRNGWLTQIQSYLLILPRSKTFLVFYVLPLQLVKSKNGALGIFPFPKHSQLSQSSVLPHIFCVLLVIYAACMLCVLQTVN